MNPISISKTKAIREELGATHLVILAWDGEGQHVATHGATQRDADTAAKWGNALKEKIGWAPEDCKAEPLPRECGNCSFWKESGHSGYAFGARSIHDPIPGSCQLEPEVIRKSSKEMCRHFQPKY